MARVKGVFCSDAVEAALGVAGVELTTLGLTVLEAAAWLVCLLKVLPL